MQPLRALWERYNSVHWTSLVRIKMLRLDFLGPIRHFVCFQDGRYEKKQNAYKV